MGIVTTGWVDSSLLVDRKNDAKCLDDVSVGRDGVGPEEIDLESQDA